MVVGRNYIFQHSPLISTTNYILHQCSMLLLSKYMSWLGLYLSHVIIFNSYLHMVGLSFTRSLEFHPQTFFASSCTCITLVNARTLHLPFAPANNLVIDVHIKRDPSTEIHGYHPLYSPVL
jgi:hypothetical protein